MSNETCEHWQSFFSRINHYFRDDIVLNGTEHASKELGYAITAAYLVVIIFGACGNFLTMLVVVLNPAMRTTRNFFIFNLALSDFFVCTVTAPMTLYTVLYMFWPFGTALCKIAGSLQGFNIFLSTFSIAAIALDRYLLIIFPTKRERQQNLSLMFFVFIWVVSLILAVPLLIASDLNTIYEDPSCGISLRICHEQNEIWQTVNTFEWVSLFSVSTFAVCHVAAMCSACLNPLIYAFFNHNFRTEFIALFERLGLRKLRVIVFRWDEERERKMNIEEENKTRCNNGNDHTLMATRDERMDESLALNPDTDEQL
ncbi:7 transmembrane receptor [Trichostrongylus colubriformis]|uniref:7 transmembrane receptor n=1 Tax=Trichostrongylus colubriformis TaxID=6319 RepID=A0AAN8FW83_TRICO